MNPARYSLVVPPQKLRSLPYAGSRPLSQSLGQGLSVSLLCQIVSVSAVSGGVVAMGHLQLAAWCMWGLLGVALLGLVVAGRPVQVAGLLIGVAPIVNLLRGAALYSGVPLIYFAALVYVAFSLPRMTRRLVHKDRFALVMLGLAVCYYILSVVNTGDLRSNLRVLELVGAAYLVYLLAASKRLLQTALLGLLVSAWVVGASTLPHLRTTTAERLGIIATDELAIGNPFGLGVPLALGVLALCLDRGRWLGLATSSVIRLVSLIPTVVLLALSASRAGWLVASAGLLAGAVIANKQRLRLAIGIAGVVLVVTLLSLTPVGTPFKRGWDRTFSGNLDRTSSGRSGHWRIFFRAFTDSPKALLFGYGPGRGKEVYARYSYRVSDLEREHGARKPFHGLIMHIGAELGLLGLLPLGIGLVIGTLRALVTFARSSLVLPVVAFFSFVLASLTASGFDTLSGTALGLGLLAAGAERFARPRRGYMLAALTEPNCLSARVVRSTVELRSRKGLPCSN